MFLLSKVYVVNIFYILLYPLLNFL